MSRSLPRSLVLLALLAPGLSWACRSAGPIRDTVDAEGDPLRIEAAEQSQPAVDNAATAERMAAYRSRSAATAKPAPTNTAAPDTAVEAEGDAAEPPTQDLDKEDEPQVAPAVVASRMEGYRSRKPATMRVAFHADAAASAANPLADGFDPFVERDCPPEGNAKSAKNQQQNKLKNRITTPQPSDIDETVTLDTLRAPGPDTDRYSTALAATIEGYVRSAKGTGGETCNCGKTTKSLTDTHFEIVSGPGDNGQPVIAEVTPVWRLIHKHFGLEDWSSAKLSKKYAGHKVRITGWLFFDSIHASQADNTDPQDPQHDNWRATCWEIHPITSIEIVQ